jgi:hypothetical protein
MEDVPISSRITLSDVFVAADVRVYHINSLSSKNRAADHLLSFRLGLVSYKNILLMFRPPRCRRRVAERCPCHELDHPYTFLWENLSIVPSKKPTPCTERSSHQSPALRVVVPICRRLRAQQLTDSLPRRRGFSRRHDGTAQR